MEDPNTHIVSRPCGELTAAALVGQWFMRPDGIDESLVSVVLVTRYSNYTRALTPENIWSPLRTLGEG